MKEHLSLSQGTDLLEKLRFSTNISYRPALESRVYPNSIRVLSFRRMRISLDAMIARGKVNYKLEVKVISKSYKVHTIIGSYII